MWTDAAWARHLELNEEQGRERVKWDEPSTLYLQELAWTLYFFPQGRVVCFNRDTMAEHELILTREQYLEVTLGPKLLGRLPYLPFIDLPPGYATEDHEQASTV